MTTQAARDDETPTAPTRERSYGWSDPLETAALASSLSGLDFLTQMASGRLALPPILHTLGIDLIEVEEGRVVFEMTPEEWHYNPIGSVHGGALTTLADSALGCAVHSQLPVGVGYTSLDVTISFVRAATTASGPLRCEGRVITAGRRVATSRAEITDGSGRLISHASSTCLIIA